MYEFFSLRPTSVFGHIACPNCKAMYNLKWDTEHGSPLIGEHGTICPSCKNAFSFSVYHEYKSW